jgi:hypothetical protein
MKIDRKNGLFRGWFDHPLDGDERKFSGVLLQQQGIGRGVFTGMQQTGSVAFAAGATYTPPTTTPTTPTNPTTNPGTSITFPTGE